MHEVWDLPNQVYCNLFTEQTQTICDWETLCSNPSSQPVSPAFLEKFLWSYLDKNFTNPEKSVSSMRIRNHEVSDDNKETNKLYNGAFYETILEWANQKYNEVIKDYFKLESLCFLWFLKRHSLSLFGISDKLKVELIRTIPDYLTDILFIFNTKQLDMLPSIFFFYFKPCNLSVFKFHPQDYSIFYYKMLSIYIKKMYEECKKSIFVKKNEEGKKSIFVKKMHDEVKNVQNLFKKFEKECRYKHVIVDPKNVNLYEIPIQAYFDNLLCSNFWDEYFLKIVNIGPKTIKQEVIYNLINFSKQELKNQEIVSLENCYFFIYPKRTYYRLDGEVYGFNGEVDFISKQHDKKKHCRTIQDFYFIANYEYGTWLKRFDWDLRVDHEQNFTIMRDPSINVRVIENLFNGAPLFPEVLPSCLLDEIHCEMDTDTDTDIDLDSSLDKNKDLESDDYFSYSFEKINELGDCPIALGSWIPENILKHFFTDCDNLQSDSEFLWEFLLRFPIIMAEANVAPPLNIPYSRIPQKKIISNYLWLSNRQFQLQQLPLKYLQAFANVIHKLPSVFLNFLYIFPKEILDSIADCNMAWGRSVIFFNIKNQIIIPEQQYSCVIKLWKHFKWSNVARRYIPLEEFLKYSLFSKYLTPIEELQFLKIYSSKDIRGWNINKDIQFILSKNNSYIFELCPSTVAAIFATENRYPEKTWPLLFLYYNELVKKNIDVRCLEILFSQLVETSRGIFILTIRNWTYQMLVSDRILLQFIRALSYWQRDNVVKNHFVADHIHLTFNKYDREFIRGLPFYDNLVFNFMCNDM